MIVSNSEVESFNSCPRKHFYQFGLGLQPRAVPKHIRTGLLGHEVLEAYYRTMITDVNRSEWIAAGLAVLEQHTAVAQMQEDLDSVALVRTRFMEYVEHYQGDKWRVVDVESKFTEPLDSQVSLGITLDLLVEEIAGPYRGQYLVIDHKWTARFHTSEELAMHWQLPKYMYVLQKNGYDVRRGILNEIKTGVGRTDKVFRRSVIKTPVQRLNTFVEEQRIASHQIARFVKMPVAQWRQEARRHISRWNCGSCPFNMPCQMEIDGRDLEASQILRIDYDENSYGYRG